MPYFQYESSESNISFGFAWEMGEGGESQVVDVTHPTSSSGCRSSMDLQAKSSSSSSVNINKEDQDSNFEIFKSNYENLPNYLRSSLDYCSLWSSIGKKLMVRYMLAEGLVEEKAGEILEDTASNILQQLISLGMIQEEEFSFPDYHRDGPSIKVVNHYRKLSVVKVDEQDFLAKPQDSPISYAYVYVKEGEYYNPLNFKSHPIRFLSMHNLNGFPKTTSVINVCYSQFLLVLNLFNYWSKSNYLPDQVGDLVHLRYLGLEFIKLKELPQTLGNLRNLQTLEVNWCENQLKLPVEVLKITNLRHLKISDVERFIVPKGIGRLVNLYTCLGVCARGGIISELSTLTQLREFGITHVSEENISEIFAAIMKMENLVSLSLKAETIKFEGKRLMLFPAELESFSPPPLLQELHLDGGHFEMPNWLASMVNLTTLSLYFSNLSENQSLVLQFLPELKHLCLGRGAYNAKVIGKEFCSANGFPKLESLVIMSDSLIEWTEVLDGAFPNLRSLNLECCWKLRFLPESLQNITTLEELYLPEQAQDLAKRLKGEENYKIKHISKVYIGDEDLLNENV